MCEKFYDPTILVRADERIQPFSLDLIKVVWVSVKSIYWPINIEKYAYTNKIPSHEVNPKPMKSNEK